MDRRSILERIRKGSLTPDEGERQAEKAGLPSLRQPDPDASLFSPETLSFWSPAMVVAWIVWRSWEAVLFEMQDYNDAREVWQEVKIEHGEVTGWRLGVPARPDMTRINRTYPFTADHSETSSERVSDAVTELMNELRSGRLTATGVEFPRRVPREIEPSEWLQLRHGWSPNDGDTFYFASDARRHVVSVEFRQSQVTAIWPAAGLSGPAIGESRPRQSVVPPPAKRKTLQQKLLEGFFSDSSACPDPTDPDDGKVYGQFVEWLDTRKARTIPSQSTFRRHRQRWSGAK